ncbi:ABC transporter permease [Ureaplasma diversum]|uniref:Oligopeptide ABC transporter, permease protein n=2 Tax=Ureaplasma diversum TaxID=42094 RepID=A0A084EX35_9BACT|nr:ABC transporter permease [Ureaplasma diversum]AJQ45262.1 ABC transporter permease [Ureaplasma diversum]KEZ22527.1 Oligopeptide ABC transporter, permease protein [Ureaplasma diversum NCTC 246]
MKASSNSVNYKNKNYKLFNNYVDFKTITRANTSKKNWFLAFFDSVYWKILWKIIKIMLEFIAIAWVVITITFFLINSIPGSSFSNPGASEAARKAIEAKYGLNLPIGERYLLYLKNILRGDFGISFTVQPDVPINDFIWHRFFISFVIGIFSVFLTVFIGIPIGVWVGKNPGGLLDQVSTIVVSVFSSIPSLVFALLLVLIGRELNIPYTFDIKNFATYILPGLALSLGSIIVYIKYIRTEMNRELNSMHAKFASLKGMKRRVFVWRHALKPSLFPIATFFPAVIFGSFIGSLFVEQIFQIAGSGGALISAITSKDYNVILFLVVMFSLLTILSFTFRDILYEAIDPRVRRRGR